MTDPYEILGIGRNATDDEVKSAYRKLAKKYHPDNYESSPIADLAAEKMKEINEAYDTIMEQRRKYRSENNTSWYNGEKSNYRDVRSLIMSGRIFDADQILSGVPEPSRDAEWYFLKGTILYKKGWLEESYNHFKRANDMNPQNKEYEMAFNQVQNQRNGNFSGYNMNMNRTGCSGCDVCTSLMCADCCCECMGGDFIRCC